MTANLHTPPEPPRRYTEDPQKSVLCIGHLRPERANESAAPFGRPSRWYRERLRYLFRSLSAEGYNTYIVTSWDRFTALAMLSLRENKPAMITDYGLDFVYSMGIFEANRPCTPSFLPSDFLDEVLMPREDDCFLTTEEVFDTVLSEVSAVLFDNADRDPFVRSILDKAVSLGKRMIDIDSSSC